MMRRSLSPDQFDSFVESLDETPIGTHEGKPVLISHTASWAVWSEGAEDIAPTDDWLRRQDLTTSVILLGANWGSNPDHISALVKDRWATFHTDPTKNPVHPKPDENEVHDLRLLPHQKLKRAIMRDSGDSPARGAYMTDLIKMVPTRNTEELLRQNQNVAELRPSADAFAHELSLARDHNAGAPPLIIALGQNTYRMLLGGNWRERREDISPAEREKRARKTYRDAPLTTSFADIVQAELGVPAESVARYATHYARQGPITPQFLAESIARAIERHEKKSEPDFLVKDGYRILKTGL